MYGKWLLSILFSSVATVAYAAALDLPAGVDAARAGQQLSEPTVAPADKSPPVTSGSTMPAFTPAPGTEKVTFRLNRLEVTGNTAFTQAELLPIYAAYLHREISLADLQKIAHSITLKYRQAGYLLSRAVVPAQAIDQSGIVKIRIVEGYIDATQVQTATAANPLIEKYGDAITQHIPLKATRLERYTLLGNDIPGMERLKTIIRPSVAANAPAGAADILFVPEFSRASGFVTYDNRGTKYLGPNEFSAGGALNSILQAGDQWGARGLISSDGREIQYANIYTRQPIAATGATVGISATNSLTRPGYLLRPLEVKGHSQEVVTDLDIPWIRTRQQSLYTVLALDYLNNQTDLDAFNFNLYDDRIRSLRFAVNYYLQDKWAGANQATLQVSHGLPILNASSDDQFNLSRLQGDPEYTKFNAALSRLQLLTPHISLLLAGIGQFTNQPLLSAEQFAFGGNDFGQAYDPAEITGDRGMAAKAELRYNAAPDWRFLHNIQYFAFYDIGKIWNVLPVTQTGLPQEASGASTGLGVRMNFNPYITGTAEMAQPLTRMVATNQSYAPRFFVSLTFSGKTTPSAEPQLPATPGYGSGAATNGPVAQAAAR